MSREIKFRAWDIKENKWASKEFGLGNAGGFNGEYTKSNASYIGMNNNEVDVDKLNDGAYIIEQYTGIKDKNGKDIYEGDIVDKQYYNLRIIKGISEVKLDIGYDSDGYNHSKWFGFMAGNSSLIDVADYCEVIGNIHETPELLK